MLYNIGRDYIKRAFQHTFVLTVIHNKTSPIEDISEVALILATFHPKVLYSF
jgi:hypothetical protein